MKGKHSYKKVIIDCLLSKVEKMDKFLIRREKLSEITRKALPLEENDPGTRLQYCSMMLSAVNPENGEVPLPGMEAAIYVLQYLLHYRYFQDKEVGQVVFEEKAHPKGVPHLFPVIQWKNVTAAVTYEKYGRFALVSLQGMDRAGRVIPGHARPAWADRTWDQEFDRNVLRSPRVDPVSERSLGFFVSEMKFLMNPITLYSRDDL